MRPREAISALIIFVLVSLLLATGSEIISIPSPHDDAFYVRKSLSLFGSWSDLATLKEIGSPVFFRLVRFLGIPLRVAFSLGYGLSLFWLLVELRRWAFPAAICRAAAMLPLFLPSQFEVFGRASADPLSVILTMCLFVSCMAVYRKRADWPSVLIMAAIAACIWLDRPEGILAEFPALFVLAMVLFAKRDEAFLRALGKFAARATASLAVLAVTMAGIDLLNWHYYGFAAQTIRTEPRFQSALKHLMSIDDGMPPVRGRSVSKRALELACANSPAVAQARDFWASNCDGNGWSALARLPDGSIGEGLVQFVLIDSGFRMGGSNPVDALNYLGRVGDELETAMQKNALHRRFVLSTALGPAFNPFGAPYWRSFAAVGMGMLNGEGAVIPPRDSAPEEQNLIFDVACSRRNGLLARENPPRIRIRGWVTMANKPELPLSLSLLPENATASLKLEDRPDVPKAIFGKDISPAYCGFDLTINANSIHAPALAVTGDGSQEQFSGMDLGFVSGADTVHGKVHTHVDDVTFSNLVKYSPSKNWRFFDKAGQWLSRIMLYNALVALVAFLATALQSSKAATGMRSGIIAVTVIMISVVLPKWLLLAGTDASIYTGVERRFLMPSSAVVWAWEALCIGVALAVLLTRKPEAASTDGLTAKAD